MKSLFITALAIALVSAAPTPMDAAAALEERQGAPAPGVNPGDPWHGIPWNPGPKDRVKRPQGDRGKRADETTEGNPWGPWKDDKEKRQHEPHKEGNP